MQGDAISSGFACISRRFSAGLVELSQGKSTPKCRQRRRNCASGILETHSNPAICDTIWGYYGDGLTLHIDEAIPGEGLFDYEALLSACDALDPDLPVMCEHLETEAEYLKASGFLQEKAARMGIQPLLGHE